MRKSGRKKREVEWEPGGGLISRSSLVSPSSEAELREETDSTEE